MPSFTIISCAVAAIRRGAVPVLVDAEPETWGMDVSQVEAKVTPKTKAIMAVHTYGHPVDMDPLLEIARKHKLIVIEDAAEVHGAEYKGRRCGSIGDISAWSFYANKIITTGEGGMVTTSNKVMAERAASYRNLLPPRAQILSHRARLQFPDDESAGGDRSGADGARRGIRRHQAATRRLLPQAARVGGGNSLPGREAVGEVRTGCTASSWMSLSVSTPRRRCASSAHAGLERGRSSFGLHEQPVLHDLGLFRREKYPVAERIARQGFYLPSGLTLTGKTSTRSSPTYVKSSAPSAAKKTTESINGNHNTHHLPSLRFPESPRCLLGWRPVHQRLRSQGKDRKGDEGAARSHHVREMRAAPAPPHRATGAALLSATTGTARASPTRCAARCGTSPRRSSR